MTLTSAPTVIDGAQTPAGHIRKGLYAALGNVEGVVTSTDLKVSQLAVPGPGLLISAGNAVILNRYLAMPIENYVVPNPDTHTVPQSQMPSAQPVAKSYLVLVTVGDPEFSQVGHPWMTSDELDPIEALSFQYNRIHILEVPAGTTSFADLGAAYPAYALARLDIPANTTTITNAMITDLREIANPSVKEVSQHANNGNSSSINSAANVYMQIGVPFAVKIPKWATTAKIQGWIEALYLNGGTSSNGDIRVAVINGSGTPGTTFDETAQGVSSDLTRYGYNIGGEIAIPEAMRGTTQSFRVEGRVYSAASQSKMKWDTKTSSYIKVRFEEAPA